MLKSSAHIDQVILDKAGLGRHVSLSESQNAWLQNALQKKIELFKQAKVIYDEARRLQELTICVAANSVRTNAIVETNAALYNCWLANQRNAAVFVTGSCNYPYRAFWDYPDVLLATAASPGLIDARPEDQRLRRRITPRLEKLFSEFAVFFVKFKQLLLDQIRAHALAKRRIHLGNKIDLTSLLRNLLSGDAHSRKENSALSTNFLNHGCSISESRDSQGVISWKQRNKRSSASTKHMQFVAGAASPAF